VTSRAGIGASNVITYALIKRAVLQLKKKGAQPFPDGYYHAKVSHETYFDLTQDSHWIDVATYQNDTRVQKYELGTIYKVKFFEMDNGKTFSNETYLYGTKADLTATAFNASTRTMTVSDTITEDEARELTGKLVYVQYTKSEVDYVTPMCVEEVNAGAKTVKFRWVPADTTDWTTTNALKVVPSGGATSGDEVHATLIYGKDAYGIVQLGGKGTPNIQTIVKSPGSSGSDDPLNQRGTIAWKVPFFACAVLNDDFICRVEHGVSD
jgi:hypothetical protein